MRKCSRLWKSLQVKFLSQNVYLKCPNSTPKTHFQWTQSNWVALWIGLCRISLDSKWLRQRILREFVEFPSPSVQPHPVDKIAAEHWTGGRWNCQWTRWIILKCKLSLRSWRQLIVLYRNTKCRRHTKQCVLDENNEILNRSAGILLTVFLDGSFLFRRITKITESFQESLMNWTSIRHRVFIQSMRPFVIYSWFQKLFGYHRPLSNTMPNWTVHIYSSKINDDFLYLTTSNKSSLCPLSFFDRIILHKVPSLYHKWLYYAKCMEFQRFELSSKGNIIIKATNNTALKEGMCEIRQNYMNWASIFIYLVPE